MNDGFPEDPEEKGRPDPREDFVDRVDREQKRRIRSEKRGRLSAWFGLGMFGLIGWSVAVPMLLGIGVGWWVDSTWPGSYSWTLMLMVGGLFLGVINAWQWIAREYDEIKREHSEDENNH